MFNWKLAYAPHCECKNADIKTISDLENSGYEITKASVPGNFELDLMRDGKIEDLYFSENTLKAQELENMHVWYFSKFDAEKDEFLNFEGIDTVADIYVNGKLAAHSNNMFVPCEVHDGICAGENEVVVHILPACIEARKYEVESGTLAFRYNFASLSIRKAPHMYGWDIMPRIISAGLWKDVSLKKRKKDFIRDIHIMTNSISECGTAHMRVCLNTELSGDFATDYSIRLRGVCQDSTFEITEHMWHNGCQFRLDVENAKLWYPKNYGDANLYTVSAELLYKGETVDSREMKIGIRTVELVTSDSQSFDDIGDFCFKINGKRIFAMGTNHVPLDAFHSQDSKRLSGLLDMMNDIGCNIVRCWGGNVYESDEFFDFCDENGIMVWQDFAMGCAIYPQRGEFLDNFEREAVYQIKRLRNHPSLVLWAGDNECDQAYMGWSGYKRDPNQNVLTRVLLKDLTSLHDYTRPYLPSSPFYSERAVETGFPIPEDHLWGPRDYFKGDFYKNAKSRFASETGYHGMPSVNSLKKFLKQPEKIFEEDGTPTNEYLVHAASPELDPNANYAYRIRLFYNQICEMFENVEPEFSDLVKQSQISQAEAKKYFIEKFRLKKYDCTGIIWWNLLDGWPQVSDAVVDYYFTKKLAYHYIKRSQEPLCLMFDEPKDGMLNLYAVNDSQSSAELCYSVKDLYSGTEYARGCFTASPDSSEKVLALSHGECDDRFLLIEWTVDGKTYRNHFCTKLRGMDFKKYMTALHECSFDEFEGF